jgi:ornithine decarboxylase
LFKDQQLPLQVDGNPGVEDSFFIADLGEVYRQFKQWKRQLPRIKPFYAMKCNPDPLVLRLLASLGLGFDCASEDEIAHVLALVPSLAPSNIIFTNPCKAIRQIQYARHVGVTMLTFDNTDELRKIKMYHPNAQLVLRIWTDNSGAQCQLSRKFGVPDESIRPLLEFAKLLSLNVW